MCIKLNAVIDFIVNRLHILSDLEDLISGMLSIRQKETSPILLNCSSRNSEESLVNQVVNKWQLRLNFVQTSYKNLEPVLSFRRYVAYVFGYFMNSSSF